MLLGSGPIPFEQFATNPGYNRPVAVSTDTSLIMTVGTNRVGGGVDVELIEVSLADGSVLGRARMPYPEMSPTNRSCDTYEPTDPRYYGNFQLIVEGDTLIVAPETVNRNILWSQNHFPGTPAAPLNGFLAAFDLVDGLSSAPRWELEGDPCNDGAFEGSSVGNFGTLMVSQDVVITQPRNARHRDGWVTTDGYAEFIARDLLTGEIVWETPMRLRNDQFFANSPDGWYSAGSGRNHNLMDADGAIYTTAQAAAGGGHAVKIDASGQVEWAIPSWQLVADGYWPPMVAVGERFNDPFWTGSPSFISASGTVYYERGPSTLIAIDDSANIGVTAPPDAPTGVQVEAQEPVPGYSARHIEVSWDPPTDPRRAVLGYVVTSEPGGHACSPTPRSWANQGAQMTDEPGTSCVVGANDNARNTVTVVAINELGESAPSEPSDPVVFGTPPEEPDPEPTDPVDPTDPTDPAEPTDPVDPTDPTDPGDPVVPEGDRCVRDPQRVNQFDDVPDDSVFCNDIAWMAEQAITTGRADGTYGPGDSVLRGHMAAFLHRYAGEPAPPAGAPSFPDVPAGFVFETAISWLAAEGITTGRPDGTFNPGGEITRGQMAAFLYRFAGEPPLPAGAPSFPDVPDGFVFEDAISWMADTGITTGQADGTFNPGGTLNRGQMSAFLSRYDALQNG